MKRITIFTGHYGSGKTENAINYALKLKEQGEEVVIVDLDIVNPYYRTKDAEIFLQEKGIEVISPLFANTNVEMMTLPSDVYKVSADKSKKVIFDVGGDDDGATALGQYFSHFQNDSYDMFVVINTKRPLTETKEKIIIILLGIAEKSRLKPTGLINNTNIAADTRIEDIKDGEKVVLEVSKELDVPFIWSTVKEDLAEEYKKHTEHEVMPLHKFMVMPWQE